MIIITKKNTNYEENNSYNDNKKKYDDGDDGENYNIDNGCNNMSLTY